MKALTMGVVMMLVCLIIQPLYAQTGTKLLEIFTLQSNTMAPALRENDKVVVDITTPFERLRIGDIIAFKTFGTNSTGQHLTIIHRIAEIVSDSHGDIIMRTKGDANNDSIPSLDYPIFPQNYIGKVIYRITAGNAIENNNMSITTRFDNPTKAR